MQPAWASLPEFERIGNDTIAAPVRRPRYIARWVSYRKLCRLSHHDHFRLDRLTLFRRPCSEAACVWPRLEILVRLLGGHFVGEAGDPDLPFEFGPEECKCGVRIFCQFAALAAVVVCIEDEPIVIVTL